MRKNKEYFEKYFDNYSPEEGNEWGINWRMSQIKRMENAAKLLTPALKKKELSVLEAGCATGDMTKVILNKINSLKCYDAFDISEKAIKICKASGMNQVNWITCGFNEMDFETDKYDLIMCCESIYYLSFYEQKECIKKLYSYLKRGGAFVYIDELC